MQDLPTGGFQPFAGLTSLQQAPCGTPPPFSVALLQHVGLKLLHQSGAREEQQESRSSHEHSQSLSDGRLNVGTHLPLMAKRYAYLSLIGEGSSAQVVLAEDTLHPARPLVAIKIMKRQYTYMGQKEIRALRYLHVHGPASMGVVKLLGSFTHGGHLCLVLEHLSVSLLEYLSHSSSLAPAVQLTHLRHIAFQLLGSMAVAHAHGVVHADLKPENILLRGASEEGSAECPQVVITDFGSAFSTSETDTARVAFEMQTLPYRAPEVVAGAGLTDGPAMDAWSLGCILAELALKRPLFPANSPSQLLAQIGHMLSSSVGATKAAAAPSASTNDTGLAGLERQRRHAWEDEVLIAQLASSESPKQSIRAWQGDLCRLGAELAKVDLALCDLVLKLLCWDPAKRLSTIDALLHPFFDVMSPVRHLLQVVPYRGSAEPGMQLAKPMGLQTLMQHASSASRRAPAVVDSRASPAPSCPTPISQRPAGTKTYEEAHQGVRPSRLGASPKQALSAPLLLAQPLALESPALIGDALLAPRQAVRAAVASRAAADARSDAEHSGHNASTGRDAAASAAGDVTVTATATLSAPAGEGSHEGGAHGSFAQHSATENGTLKAALHTISVHSLPSLSHPCDVPGQRADSEEQQQAGVGCEAKSGAKSRSGKSARQGAAQMLFPELHARLPPFAYTLAGYTNTYDFPEGALAVADSFLRDAPSSEQPELPSMPSETPIVPATEHASPSTIGAALAAAAQAARARAAEAPLQDQLSGPPSKAAAGPPIGDSTSSPPQAAADALARERTPAQGMATTRASVQAQETEQRSGRSSVTPHKASDRAEMETDSNSSQAAHQSQAGISIPVRVQNQAGTMQNGGSPGSEAHVESSRAGTVGQQAQEGRTDHNRGPQRNMGSPSRGLDMLAAAASTVSTVPQQGPPMAETPKKRGRPKSAPLTARKGRAPDQAAPAGATPGKKRRAPSWVDIAGSPSPARKRKSDATAAPATPSARGKPGRPKTPGRPRATAAGSASPVKKGAEGSRALKNLDHGAPSASPEPVGRRQAKTPGTAGRKLLKKPALRSASGTPQAGSPPVSRQRADVDQSASASAGGQSAARSGTPALRKRVPVAEKGAKPWWVV